LLDLLRVRPMTPLESRLDELREATRGALHDAELLAAAERCGWAMSVEGMRMRARLSLVRLRNLASKLEKSL
jgi:hypothetical protein